MRKIKLGVIGLGNMGSSHIRNISSGLCPEIEVKAICDIKPDRVTEMKKAVPDAAEFNNAVEMMDSGLIDSVIICVPHFQHPGLAIDAMKRGLNVMCEKPAGVYTKQVREMNEQAKNSNVVFGMMFNQRTNCLYRKMKELVDNGTIGKIRRVNWIITDWFRTQLYYDSGDWRATWSGEGGGVLLNQCPHQIDLLQWICGMPCRVDAKLHYGKWHDIEVEDDVTAYLEFPGGATGVFVTTTADSPGTNRFEITGDLGKMVCEDGKLMLTTNDISCDEFIKSADTAFGKIACKTVEVETDGENPQHAGVLNAFANAILRGGKLVADGVEGIRGLTLSNAMHLSSWLGRPVDIPFDEELYYKELMKRVSASRRKENVVETVSDTKGSY